MIPEGAIIERMAMRDYHPEHSLYPELIHRPWHPNRKILWRWCCPHCMDKAKKSYDVDVYKQKIMKENGIEEW